MRVGNLLAAKKLIWHLTLAVAYQIYGRARIYPLPNPDELTSYSTKAGKAFSQVAGYPPVGSKMQIPI